MSESEAMAAVYSAVDEVNAAAHFAAEQQVAAIVAAPAGSPGGIDDVDAAHAAAMAVRGA